MILAHLSRQDFLKMLPKGGVVAEIGVAQGDFSQKIMEQVQPERLHLIDPWEHQERDDYLHDMNNVSHKLQDDRYQGVLTRFAQWIDQGRIRVHKKYSFAAVNEFDDGSLDWVYIDGLHTYEGVKSDLEQWSRKVKPNGFILGHDYTNHHEAMAMGFGVVEAVNDFVIENQYDFSLLMFEFWSTYVLCKNKNMPELAMLYAKIFYSGARFVIVDDFPHGYSYKTEVVKVNDQAFMLPIIKVEQKE